MDIKTIKLCKSVQVSVPAVMALLPMGRVPGTSTWGDMASHHPPFKPAKRRKGEQPVAIGTGSLGGDEASL
jgi:hypothetical protein